MSATACNLLGNRGGMIRALNVLGHLSEKSGCGPGDHLKGVLARARFHFRLDATLVFRVLKALSDTGNEQKRERRNVVFKKKVA